MQLGIMKTFHVGIKKPHQIQILLAENDKWPLQYSFTFWIKEILLPVSLECAKLSLPSPSPFIVGILTATFFTSVQIVINANAKEK